MEIHFLTGNQHKLEEARGILQGHDVRSMRIDLPELQSLDPQEIVEAKLSAADAHLHGKPYFVEDVSFWVGDTGFPGPLFKFMYSALGREGVVRFARAFGQETARAVCTIGLRLPGRDPAYFTGEVVGRIVDPRGDSGFGFDPIFVPDGSELTWAEMGSKLKSEDSHRSRALEQMVAYLGS